MHTIRWVSIDKNQVSWREWEGEFVVFDNLAAATHELDLRGGIVLTALLDAACPLSAEELDNTLFCDVPGNSGYGTEDRFPLHPVLAELERIGLVKSCQP